MSRSIGIIFLLVVVVLQFLLVVTPGRAQVPGLLFYQGRFAQQDGTTLSGSYEVRFTLYDSKDGGNTIWGPVDRVVEFDRGVFSVYLGKKSAAALENLDFDKKYWLEVQLVGTGTPYSYREEFAATPYTFNTHHFEGLRLNEIDWSDLAIEKVDIEQTDINLEKVQNINQATMAGNQLEWDTAQEKFHVLEGAGSDLDADLLEGRHAGNGPDSIPINNGQLNNNLNVRYLAGDTPAVIDWEDLAIKTGDITKTDINLENVQNIDQATMAGNQLKWDTTSETLNVIEGAGSDLEADLLEGRHAGNASGSIPINNGALNENLSAEFIDSQPVSYYKQNLENVLSQGNTAQNDMYVQGQKIYFSDDQSGNNLELTATPGSNNDYGVTLRTVTNPNAGNALFRVLTAGGSSLFWVQHSGETGTSLNFYAGGGLSTAGTLEMSGGNIYDPGIVNMNSHSNGRVVAPVVQ